MSKSIKYIVLISCTALLLLSASCGNNIYKAAQQGDIATVEKALARNPKAIRLFSDNHHFTLLHYAARFGKVKMVKFLLQKGAHVDTRARNHFGFTPFHLAAFNGHIEVLQVLMEHGADINLCCKGNMDGINAIGMAIPGKRLDTAKFLIDKGVKVENTPKYYARPLVIAAKYGHTKIIDLLVKNGAIINTNEEKEWTALHSAVLYRRTETVKRLITLGADVNKFSPWGKTPIHQMIYWKLPQPEIIRFMADNGAQLHLLENNGKSPLEIALFSGFKKCTSILLEKGAPINKTYDHKIISLVARYSLNSPRGAAEVILSMHRAAARGDLKLLETSFSKYPQLLNAGDRTGKTPLHYAAQNNHIRAAQFLISNGADVDAVTSFNHIQLLHGVMAKLMIPRLGRVKWKEERKTPLELARHNGHKEMIQLLEQSKKVQREISND